MIHENDEARGGCEFGTFFQTTPQDLIADGLYKMVALELLPAPHDAVSAVHLARTVGATTTAPFACTAGTPSRRT